MTEQLEHLTSTGINTQHHQNKNQSILYPNDFKVRDTMLGWCSSVAECLPSLHQDSGFDLQVWGHRRQKNKRTPQNLKAEQNPYNLIVHLQKIKGSTFQHKGTKDQPPPPHTEEGGLAFLFVCLGMWPLAGPPCPNGCAHGSTNWNQQATTNQSINQ